MKLHTLAYALSLGAIAAALPYSFILDVGSINAGVIDAPPAASQQNMTTEIPTPSSTAKTMIHLSTTIASTFTTAPAQTSDATTVTINSTTRTSHPPTTTITITLARLTPVPSTNASHNEDVNLSGDDEQREQRGYGDPFTADDPHPVSKWPPWMTAATFTLFFYDIITFGLFLWLWVFGYLEWLGRDSGRQRAEATEMIRMDRLGRYERGRGGYGRVRSESWARVRTATEAELEANMSRLGFI